MHTSSANSDYYAILGVSPAATQKELRKAYLQLLVTAHPDKGGDRDAFAAIQRAYDVLTDPAERVIYDEQQQRNTSTSSASSSAQHKITTQGSRYSVTTNANGVTAVVHGQTCTAPAPSLSSSHGAFSAGKQSDVDLTNAIQTLRKSLVCSQDQEMLKRIALLHVERGNAHLASGRPHHAAFDAKEALALCPIHCKEAEDLVKRVEKAEDPTYNVQQQQEEESDEKRK